MGYLEIINSIGPIATAGALIWSLIQHRLDNNRLNKQIDDERKKYIQERADYEYNQIEIKIARLNDTFNSYTEIFLVTEKLKWVLTKMKGDVLEQKDINININDYESYFVQISNILSDLSPWQQSIIGDLPIDPLINNYYSYYEYKKADELLSWIVHFEEQVKEAASDSTKMTTRVSKLIEQLQIRLKDL